MELSDLLFLLSLLGKAVCLWFVLVAAAGMARRRPAFPACAPKHKFAVLAAARNEQDVIGGFVQSLREQSYPSALFDVYVLPNNCTDHTAQAARNAGAQVLDCPPSVRCKGDALHYAIARLLAEQPGYDAFCVFDADNQPEPGFLARMNDAFCSGAQVAKGRIAAQNPTGSWVAGCYGLYFKLFDWFFSAPRAALGLSAKLVGTGFAVHRQVLERLGGWNTHTLAEDAEFAAQCAQLGIQVAWVPGAVTRDVQPLGFSTSLTQRRRWISGIMQAGKTKLPTLARAKNWRAVDSVFFFLSPFAGAVGAILSALGAALALARGGLPFWALAAGAAAGYFALTALACALRLTQPQNERAGWGTVFGFALFMACWAPLETYSLVRPVRRWKPIAHGQAARLPHHRKRRPSPAERLSKPGAALLLNCKRPRARQGMIPLPARGLYNCNLAAVIIFSKETPAAADAWGWKRTRQGVRPPVPCPHR